VSIDQVGRLWNGIVKDRCHKWSATVVDTCTHCNAASVVAVPSLPCRRCRLAAREPHTNMVLSSLFSLARSALRACHTTRSTQSKTLPIDMYVFQRDDMEIFIWRFLAADANS
jgi:hypothetical protein